MYTKNDGMSKGLKQLGHPLCTSLPATELIAPLKVVVFQCQQDSHNVLFITFSDRATLLFYLCEHCKSTFLCA